MPLNLTPERGLLFRIAHVANLPWLLANGIHCANSAEQDPNFIAIGNPELIESRKQRRVPIHPHGTLSDYVPFYFTPKSVMLFNITSGWNGITKRPNQEIVILVSSCKSMIDHGVFMLFTDRHAYTETVAWTCDPVDLATTIDWDILRRHDFARNDGYPDKKDRYQAEALAHNYVPREALLGVGCVSAAVKSGIESSVHAAGLKLKVVVRPEWYF